MSGRYIETGQGLGISDIPEFTRRIDKYGMELGDALDNAVLVERQLGPMTSERLSERSLGVIVSARRRLVVQVELARKSGDPARANLAEEAVTEYAAIFPQAEGTVDVPTDEDTVDVPTRAHPTFYAIKEFLEHLP